MDRLWQLSARVRAGAVSGFFAVQHTQLRNQVGHLVNVKQPKSALLWLLLLVSRYMNLGDLVFICRHVTKVFISHVLLLIISFFMLMLTNRQTRCCYSHVSGNIHKRLLFQHLKGQRAWTSSVFFRAEYVATLHEQMNSQKICACAKILSDSCFHWWQGLENRVNPPTSNFFIVQYDLPKQNIKNSIPKAGLQ